jgi:hypothetical protein
MRVLFVDNLLIDRQAGLDPFDLQPHLGLLSLIAVAEQGGHEADLFDPKLELVRGTLSLKESLYRDWAAALLDRRPDVVGFTSLGCNFICTIKVAGHLKRMRPGLPVVLGGPHATILERRILDRYPEIDVVARNEAETTLLPLIDALGGGGLDRVAGVSFRRGGRVMTNPGAPLIDDLDALPRAAYARYPIRELGLTSLRVEAGRGCPFKCTFCSTAGFFGRRYRLKSAKRLVSELDELANLHGVRDFALTHDLFTVNRAKVREFCDAVAGRGYTWSCSARMDCVDAELLAQMERAGCRSIYYGVETGSPRMQRVTRKDQDLGLVAPILDATARLGMRAVASFITGYPQEEQIDQDQTLDLVGDCLARGADLLDVQLHLLTPEPGAPLLAELGGTLAYDGHISDFNFATLEADDAEIMARDPQIFVNHHHFATVILRARHVFVTSVYTALHALGHPLLTHLLRRYGGRLSLFVSEMFAWATTRGLGTPSSPDFVVAFAENRWGRGDYLTSLVRYMAAADALRPRRIGERGDRTGPIEARRGRRFVLSRRAHVLRDLHDCPELFGRLDAGGPDAIGPGALSVERTRHYLLFLDSDRSRTMRNFVLDEATADLLDLLVEPRRRAECSACHRARHAMGAFAPLFQELLRVGVIRELPAIRVARERDRTLSPAGAS